MRDRNLNLWRLRPLIFLVLLSLLAPLWLVAQRWRQERDWHLWAQGQRVAVHIERSLYAAPRGDSFLAHVRVSNLTGRTLLIDFDPTIDPIRPVLVFRAASFAGRQPIKVWVAPFYARELMQNAQKHRRQKRLTPLSAGQSLDYFINSVAPNSRSRLTSQNWSGSNSLMGVDMNGNLPVVDGQKIEIISDATGVETTQGVRYSNGLVSILAPGEWKPLPNGARVLRR